MIEMTIQRVLPSGDIIITCGSIREAYVNVTKSQAEQMFRKDYGLERRHIIRHYPTDKALNPAHSSDRMRGGGKNV